MDRLAAWVYNGDLMSFNFLYRNKLKAKDHLTYDRRTLAKQFGNNLEQVPYLENWDSQIRCSDEAERKEVSAANNTVRNTYVYLARDHLSYFG